MTNKFFLFLVTFSLNIVFVYGQAKIKGTVYDSSNIPLAGVAVSVVSNGNIIKTATSSRSGSYAIEPPVGDSINILFKSIGFQDINILVPRIRSVDVNLNVVMKDVDYALDSVTVVANRPNRTINMTMDLFDTKDRAYLLDSNIESIITSLPGVSSTNELSSQYKVRGGNFDENKVYVNGIEVYRPLLTRSAEQEGLSFINPTMVQSVAFSTGGYDAEYGDIMSSVLDITYKTPGKFEGTIGASLMDASVYIGNSTNKFSQITSARYKTNKSLLNTTDTEGNYDPTYLNFQTFMTLDLIPRWQLSFLGNYSGDSYEFTPETRNTSFGGLNSLKNLKVFFDGWEKDQFITYQTALSLKGKIGNKVEVGFTGSYFSSLEQERYDIGGRYRLTEVEDLENPEDTNNALLGVGKYHEHARNKLDMNVLDLSHFGTWKLNKHSVKWGVSMRKEDYTDKIKEWEMRDSTGYLLPNNPNIVEMYANLKSNNSVNSTRFSGFLQDRYQFSTGIGLFTATAGVRASYWNFNEELILSPRASISYIPRANENFTFRLAGGVYYQAPFYKEYQRIATDEYGNNIITPNKDIKSQKSDHLVLGGDYYFKAGSRNLKFTSELYYKKLSNLIPYTVDNVKVRYSGINEGKGYITGIDFRLFGEFVPNTTSWLSFSLMKTQQEIDNITTPLPTDQRYNISLYFQDYMPGYERLKVHLKGVFADGIPFTSPHKTFNDRYFRTSAYKRIDLGFAWEVLGENYAIRKNNSFCGAFRNVWLGLDVINLFDIRNVNTHYWITDVNSQQYAIPNYLTGRQVNVRLLVDF